MPSLTLAYRPPYDWDAMVAFLSARATPGVESVGQLNYRRTISVDGKHGVIKVSPAERGPSLVLEVDCLQLRRDSLEARAADKVDRAARATGRLSKLVDMLLDVSRLTEGQLQLQLERCDLVLIATEVVERMRPEAEQSKCDLSLHGSDRLIGRWDRARLDQCLTNLVSNAIKYGAGKPIERLVDAARRADARALARPVRPTDPSHHLPP